MRILYILIISILIISISYSLFLTQTLKFKKEITDISRISGEEIIIATTKSVSRIKIDGTMKEIIELMEDERAYISPRGTNFLVVGRPDKTNTRKITLYDTEEEFPIYTSIASDGEFFVKDGGDTLIGYTVNGDVIKINFYDENGVVNVDRDYENYQDIQINDNGYVFLNCGDEGIYTIDNQGNEYGNIRYFSHYAIPRTGDKIAGFDGEQIYFYSNNREDYRLYIDLTDVKGMDFSPSANYLITWDSKAIYLVDSIEFLEEWKQNILDPSLIIQDIDVDEEVQNIVYITLRDWGDAFPPEERYTEPAVILLDEMGYQRYIETLDIEGCSPDNFNLDIDDNGINIYIQTPKNLFLFKN